MGRGTKQIATIADCRYLDSKSFPEEVIIAQPYKTINTSFYNNLGNPFKTVFTTAKKIDTIKFSDYTTSNEQDNTKKYTVSVTLSLDYDISNQSTLQYYVTPVYPNNADSSRIYLIVTSTSTAPTSISSPNVVSYATCEGVICPEYGSSSSINDDGNCVCSLNYNQFWNKTYYVWLYATSAFTYYLYDRNDNKITGTWTGKEVLYGNIGYSIEELKEDYNEKQCPRASEAKKYFYTTSGLNLHVGNSLTSYMHLIKKSQTIRPDIIGWCSNNDAVPAALSSKQYYGIYGTTNYSNKNLTIDCTVYPSTTGSTSYGNATTKSLKYNTATRYTGTTLYPTDVKNGYFKLDIDFSFPAIQVNPSTIGKVGGANIRLTRDVKVNVRVEHYGNAGTYNETYPVTFVQTGTVNTSTGIYTFDAVNVSKVFNTIPFYNGKSIQNPKIYIWNPTITWTTANGGSSATSEIGLWEDE